MYIRPCSSKDQGFAFPQASETATMAVTHQSEGNLKKQVKEVAGSSCREGTDARLYGLPKLRKSDVPPPGPRDIKKDACGLVTSCKRRRNQNEDNKSEMLSDIDDAEVSRYLNTKKEFDLKRLLWEALNGTYIKAKKQKRTETKKCPSSRKAANPTEKSDIKRRSSMINYEALEMLDDELEKSETAENSQHGNISHKTLGSNKTSYEDDQHDISYHEDDDEFCEGEMYNGYGDEHYSDEYY